MRQVDFFHELVLPQEHRQELRAGVADAVLEQLQLPQVLEVRTACQEMFEPLHLEIILREIDLHVGIRTQHWDLRNVLVFQSAPGVAEAPILLFLADLPRCL
eukprot:14948276-Alexandrium_andersonii.AAC.2